MIKSVKIENYKSIQSLEVDVGRFNVIIGENGAGKSNFLEALVFFGAAEADKLDNEFLVSRGVRAVEYSKLLSLFKKNSRDIQIEVSIQGYTSKIQINSLESLPITNPYNKNISYVNIEEDIKGDFDKIESSENRINSILSKLQKLESSSPRYINSQDDDMKKLGKDLEQLIISVKSAIEEQKENLEIVRKQYNIISDFLLYSPENTALRNFYREGQIEPLGINGEGLLKLLKVMQESEPTAFQDVLTCLELFDWFEQIDVPKDITSLEDKVNIKDKYLSVMFDQRSANEGFLFVLFYAALFCSQYTPKIFAIDNIDASFNPKLCTAIIKKLVELAKKYDKQVFVTTHNPAILDGIDLGDEEQKLFVASRNKQGHTRFKTLTIADKPKSSTGEPIRLSEAFLRGYLGGLPKNF